ncbi:MAG TPA: LysM peptidoglycan-binding domain-containing protein [Lacunisphaera sp.]|jgi:LysM repeat protein|nr:LysM peptidoglycan-binding domain-containing protein [Lacunisphaera sp.]
MKILQIFGAVVAVHLLAFIFIFASPGCQSGPRNIPTPDSTMPSTSAVSAPSYGTPTTPAPVDLGTAPAPTVTYAPANDFGHAAPTRPGSPAAAAVTPSKAVANVEPVSTYTVVRGDNLWNLAKKNNLTVSELARANNLSTGAVLQPGKKLIIPGKAPARDLEAAPAAKPAGAEKAAAAAHNSDAVKHTVMPGESLGIIARKYQVSTGELAAANNITDPSKVRAGQVLVIPGFKAVSGKGTTATKPAANARPAGANGAKSAPTEPPPEEKTDKPAAPHFEIAPPPPGQDLDSGLKDTNSDVPTIKVETPKDQEPPKN